MRAVLVALLLATACSPARARLTVGAPARHARAAELVAMPGFVVVPAIDLRSTAEREGASAELGFAFATSGGAMSRRSGAAVMGDDGLAWSASAAAADLAQVLAAASDRPVALHAGDASGAAAAVADGTVVVSLAIDHVAKITARNDEFSQSTSQQGSYQVTTTRTASESFGPFWTVGFRVQLGEVRGGRVVRRLVRYGAASGTSEAAYADALADLAAEIVDAVATDWIAPTASDADFDDDAVHDLL
jgi:hypothetical protein